MNFKLFIYSSLYLTLVSCQNSVDLPASDSGGGSGAITGSLNASEICTGSSDGGVSGIAICQTATATNIGAAAQLIAGEEFFDSSGALITGTMVDQGAWNLTTTFPGAGFYNGVSNLAAATEICTGNTILGVSGSATCGGKALMDFHPSAVFRDKGITQITIQTEKSTAGVLPAGFRIVPKISKDDDGFIGGSVTRAVHDGFECGTISSMAAGTVDRDEPAKISERIADCLNKNPVKAIWNGETNGNSSEVLWKLVSKSTNTTGKEVWVDTATGLLWSDDLGTMNWCRATGSSNATGVAAAYREVDPNDYCDNGTYQDQTNPFSACAEFTGAQPTLGGEVYTTASESYGDEKGTMGLASSANSPTVHWRLPSRVDFMLAEIHGIRHVLPSMDASFWSASVYSVNRSNAWYFYGVNDLVSVNVRSGSITVRCVGRSAWE